MAAAANRKLKAAQRKAAKIWREMKTRRIASMWHERNENQAASRYAARASRQNRPALMALAACLTSARAWRQRTSAAAHRACLCCSRKRLTILSAHIICAAGEKSYFHKRICG